MRAYNIYNNNLNTIKSYLLDAKAYFEQNGGWPGTLLLDLDTDNVFVNKSLADTGNTKVLAHADIYDPNSVFTQDAKSDNPLEMVRQTIIYWMWSEAEKKAADEFKVDASKFKALTEDDMDDEDDEDEGFGI